MQRPLVVAVALASLAAAAAAPPSLPGDDDGSTSASASTDAPASGSESPDSAADSETGSSTAGSSEPVVSDPGVAPVEVSKTIPGAAPTVPGEAPENASIDQLVAASQHFLGPSTDMAAPFAGLVDVPDGIPTPAGSVVTDMMLSINTSDDPENSYYYGSVHFESTATAGDIAEFYETLLPAAGYPQTGDSTSTSEYSRQRTLEFDNPGARYVSADITVTITESVADGDDTPSHELVWYADADADTLEPFLGWTPDLPLPADAVPRDVLMSTSNFFDVNSMSIEVTYQDENHDPISLHSTFESQLPVGGYDLNTEDDTDDTTELTGPGLPQLSIYWNEGYPAGTRMTLRGRIVI